MLQLAKTKLMMWKQYDSPMMFKCLFSFFEALLHVVGTCCLIASIQFRWFWNLHTMLIPATLFPGHMAMLDGQCFFAFLNRAIMLGVCRLYG